MADTALVPAPPTLGLALRGRDFRLLWSGQSVSLLGDSMFTVALGWTAFSLRGSGALAIVLLLDSVGMLSTLLLGGALADRYPRRRLMVASDLARLTVVVSLAAVAWAGALSLPVLGACALCMGLGGGFFQPAFGGIIPQVVHRSDALASANALVGAARNGAYLVGPALAGLLYGPLGAGGVFALDGGTFVVSAALVLLARPRPISRAAHAGEGTLKEIAAGLRYVMRVPWLWVTILLFSIYLMVVIAPLQAFLPQLVHQEFHRGAQAYGLLAGSTGGGMLVGTLVFGRLNPRRRRGLVSYVLWTVNCGFVVALALSPWYGLAAGAAAARGLLVGFGIGIWETMLMERVPEAMLSRVVSLDYFGSSGLMPLGFVLAASIAGLASPRIVIAAGGVFAGLLFAVFLPARWLRTID